MKLRRYFSEKLVQHRETALNSIKAKFKFTQENAEKAKSIIAKYPDQYKKAAVIPLLDLAQRQLGFTSIGAMNYVAELISVPKMRVYEVATFYTMFNREPVGKYLVQVCTTTPCELCGSQRILEACEKHLGIKLGETTADEKFTLVEVECAGACVNAPLFAINDDYYEDLTPEIAVKILEKIGQGEKVKSGPQSSRLAAEPISNQKTLLE